MRNLTESRIINFISDKGGYFGIIAATSITISTLISLLLHSSIDPSFNITSHVISGLGTGPEISSIVYTTGLIINSFSQYPLFLSIRNYLHKKEGSVFLIKYATLIFLISVISHNILSLVPFERSILPLFLTHGIAAAIHYVAGSISLILYGFIELLTTKVSKILVATSFIAGTFYGLLWIGYLIYFTVGIPQEAINYSLQWIALAGVIIWALLHGIFIIKAKKQDSFCISL